MYLWLPWGTTQACAEMVELQATGTSGEERGVASSKEAVLRFPCTEKWQILQT